MSLPYLRVSGTPFEQGAAHGEAFAELALHNLNVYFERLALEALLPRERVLEMAGRWLAIASSLDADYVAGLRGLAAGSRLGLTDVAVLNARYELLYSQFGLIGLARQRADGCTAFAVPPSASETGHALIGQNWDWIPDVRGVVIQSTSLDGARSLAFTEAGIFGAKIGLNDAGVGLAINGLTSTTDGWDRHALPLHARCWRVLAARSLDAAVATVAGTPRACSTNFVLGQAGRAPVDVEAAPDTASRMEAQDHPLVHANHFENPSAMGVLEAPSDLRPHSHSRQARLQALLGGGPVSLARARAALADHVGYPDSICFHENPLDPPQERYRTVTSVVMDLDALRLWATDGPPCQDSGQVFSLS